MPSRLRAAATAGLLLVSGLAVASVATAPSAVSEIIPSTTLAACTPSGPRPCVASFTRNGVPAAGFGFVASAYTVDGGAHVRFTASKDGDDDLGTAELDDTFAVTIDMGSVVPRVATGFARDVDVRRSRSRTTGRWSITVEGRPVTLSGQCAQNVTPWVCPEADVATSAPFNNKQWNALFDTEITDYGMWDDVAQRNAMFGLDSFDNIAASSVPPDIRYDGATDAYYLQVALANRRFLADGTTLVRGRAELRIPHAFLKLAYGVPDPTTMTGTSLEVTGGGSTSVTTITQEPGGQAMRVLVDRLTFPEVGVADGTYRTARAAASSMKVVRVERGVVTPARPRIAAARRLSPTKARLTHAGAKARGARITGYRARCAGGGDRVVVQGKGSRLVVRGLTAGTVYRCQVRALSKAGPSAWSPRRKVAARP